MTISGIHISDFEIFGHGLFQDILTLMETLDTDTLTKEDVIRYRDQRLKHLRKGPNIRKVRTRKPCKGCKDKNK